jgi:uncharacterized RDD family membrane protein YckC
MQNDRRRLWSTKLFVALFGTFVVVFILSFILGPRRNGEPQAGAPAATAAHGTTAIPAGLPAAARPKDSRVLAAGDGRNVWLVRPVMEGDARGYELLRRSADTGIWRIALRNVGNGVQSFWNTPGLPRSLALLLPSAGQKGDSTPYILCDSWAPGTLDMVYACSLEEGRTPQNPLPPDHVIKAAIGGHDQLFAITLGLPVPTATQPGDSLHADRLGGMAAALSVASTSAATTSAAASTAPATGASRPATTTAETTGTDLVPATASTSVGRTMFNTYWYPPTPLAGGTLPADALQPTPGDWCLLPPLGEAGAGANAPSVPTSSSFMALAVREDQLLAIWVDPKRPGELAVRTLNYSRQNAQWSKPSISQLPPNDQVPNESRLFTLLLDKTIYVLWTVPTGTTIELHGGWLKPDAAGDYQLATRIAPMVLDAAVGQVTANDVALGASRNSIVVVATNRDNVPYAMVFDNRGGLLAGVTAVAPEPPRRDLQIGQNLAMMLLVLMLTLSLWQWRQKPMPVVLPKGLTIAPLHLRALAFVMDAAVPYAMVLIAFGEWGDGGYAETIGRWMGLLSHPEDIVKSLDLVVFLGIYLVHVSLGEMFFRRSLGKAIVGLQVVTLEGKSPSVGAVLVRNLVRVPEAAVGVVLLYILLSERRQRLGDLLARTVVMAQAAEETGDKEAKK